jgi:hypothetical protein
MATAPGLTALQTFVATFQSFASQQSSDLASLNSTITGAIASLGSSEDPAVQSAVASLNTALTTVQSNETALEALNTSLSAAETPSTPSTQNAGAQSAAVKK